MKKENENVARELSIEELQALLKAKTAAKKDFIKSAKKGVKAHFKQAKIRANESARIAELNRHFVDLSSSADGSGCRVKIDNPTHFKLCFESEICTGSNCMCFEKCEAIFELLPKKSRRKSNGTTAGRINTVKYTKTVEKGVIILTDANGKWDRFTGEKWEEATKKIRDHFKTCPVNGLTKSAIAGFTHKGPANKGYPHLVKFNG